MVAQVNQAIELTRTWLFAAGVPLSHLTWLSTMLLLAATGLLAWAAAAALRFIADYIISPLVIKTATRLDDYLLGPRTIRSLKVLIVSLIMRTCIPAALAQYPASLRFAADFTAVFVVIGSVLVVNALISSFYAFLHERDRHQAGALYNLNQTLQLIAWLVALVIGISILSHRTPLYILSGIGASAAILMLVFRDTILGFVAGIQLNVNDMLRPGDWISAPKFGINGIVEKVGLTTVKVRNYDMSTVTVPPYSLFTESFQNWKSMRQAGARRIMRSICIDIDSVGFVSSDKLRQFASEPWMESTTPGGKAVNLTLFRRWLEWTIANWPTLTHPDPDHDIFSMVRELQPTPQGIPVEIYMFTTCTGWAAFEREQADLTDHVLASLGEFGLRAYQAPTAESLKRL